MKKIVLVFVSFAIVCCKPNNQESLEIKNHKGFDVDLVNREVELPDVYEKITIDDYLLVIENYIDNESVIESIYDKYYSLKLMDSDFELFVDTENYLNSITFMSSEYMHINKTVFNHYTEILSKNMKSQIDAEQEMIEKKLLNYGNTKVIKVKIKQTYNAVTKYVTQYLISSRYKTFSIAITNTQNVDFQYLLKKFYS
jgi:hypothetical protein